MFFDQIFSMIFDFWGNIVNRLNSIVIGIGGVYVNFGWLLLSFIVIAMVASVFFKGAKG